MEEEQKKLKNINGTFILFHENVYLLSSPKQTRRYVNDAAFFVSAKKKNTKIMALAANPVANFFSSSSIAPLLSV